MSDSDENPKPPSPMKKTSKVPLKKETVRVTLKATPADPSPPITSTGIPQPPITATPQAPPRTTQPMPMAQSQSLDTSPPPAPGRTAPLTTSGPPQATPITAGPPQPSPRTPTVPLKTAAGAVTPAPARTIVLKTPGNATGPLTVPLKTTPLQTGPVTGPGAPASTRPLPQATVKLQSTQELGVPTAMATQAATIQVTQDDDEKSDLAPTVLSILTFVLSLAVLALALITWTQQNEVGELFQ